MFAYVCAGDLPLVSFPCYCDSLPLPVFLRKELMCVVYIHSEIVGKGKRFVMKTVAKERTRIEMPDICTKTDTKPNTKAKPNNIVLIGMPGAGKSSVGVVLAKMLQYDFLDGDLVIQNKHKKTLQELINEYGPQGFLDRENQDLQEICVQQTVIATGGSAVYSTQAMQHLQAIGTVVYLEISYEELTVRLGDLQERGVVLKEGIGMSLADLYAERLPLYEQWANITVDVRNMTITQAAQKIQHALRL